MVRCRKVGRPLDLGWILPALATDNGLRLATDNRLKLGFEPGAYAVVNGFEDKAADTNRETEISLQ